MKRLNYSQELIERVIQNVEKVIIGKREVLETIVAACLCEGHILLEDVPGVGKTMLAKSLSKSIDCTFKRIQFTPDVLPSDILGVSIYNQKTNKFEFKEGPIMANMVLADELNRTTPKTQSAMLEAMEERHITVDGHTYSLPKPFMIIATQNSIEYEGTYSLPEAQLDRFLVKVKLGYPQQEDEVEMLDRNQRGHAAEQLKKALTKEEWTGLQKELLHVHVDESLKKYIVQLVSATREHRHIYLGASPRSSLALMKISQARAFMQGRDYVVPDDIKKMWVSTIGHRILLKPEAQLIGKTNEEVLREVLSGVSVPLLRFAAAQ